MPVEVIDVDLQAGERVELHRAGRRLRVRLFRGVDAQAKYVQQCRRVVENADDAQQSAERIRRRPVG